MMAKSPKPAKTDAKAKSTTLNIYQPIKFGGTVVKAGSYKLVIDGEKATLEDGKKDGCQLFRPPGRSAEGGFDRLRDTGWRRAGRFYSRRNQRICVERQLRVEIVRKGRGCLK